MSFEKWFDAEDNPTHEYVYVYSCDGHIVKTIDKTGLKEYNYTYDEGNLVRAVEYDVTFTGDVVTSKTRVVTISYVYTDEGELLKKRAIFDNGSESTRVPARDTDSSQFYSNASGTADFVTSATTDDLGRKVSDSVKGLTRTFTYHDGEVTPEHVRYGKVKGNATTELVDKITYSDGRTISYEYDAEERITKVIDSVDGTTEYTYDSLGQLLTEKRNGVVINSMTYDGYGNIKSKNGSIYTYGNSTWKDLLTYCKGKAITYDAQGNPTSYMGNTLVWEKGRQLKSFGTNSYTYNANGIRTSKTVSGVKHSYILDGTKVLKETWDTNTIVPLYDNEDSVCGISFNCNAYYFIKNLQGDVIALAAANKTIVARYSYDAWGVCTVTDAEGNENTTSSFIGNINPYRYRSYYYDVETGLYYLQSRYYNPSVGRFINGDGLVDNRGLNTQNMFQYCGNNPVMYTDPLGQLFGLISLGVLGIGLIIGFSGCSPTPAPAPSTSALAPAPSKPAPAPSKPVPIPSQPAQKQLTTDQKVLIATIAAEATVTAQGNPVSSAGRQAMANVAINRVGSREWSKYTTVAEICQFTGFDGYGSKNYQACMTYLNSRDGSNATYEAIILDVMAAYDNDITGGAQLYYTPAAMKPAGSTPNWNFSVLTEVSIPGVDPYYEGRFYKYK